MSTENTNSLHRANTLLNYTWVREGEVGRGRAGGGKGQKTMLSGKDWAREGREGEEGGRQGKCRNVIELHLGEGGGEEGEGEGKGKN